jgi:AcrR family transcriptional regulator
MARRTKEEALETRNRIMNAAVDVFFERGVASATLNDIANCANVTRGAIYWHFKNKLDVFDALNDRLQLSFADAILADLQNDHPHPLLQLERLCTEMIGNLEDDAEAFKVLSIMFFKCDYSGEMGGFLKIQNDRRKKNIELFSQYFARAKKHRHLPADVDPGVLAMALLSYINGLVIDYLRDPEAIAIKVNAARFMRLFFRNLG